MPVLSTAAAVQAVEIACFFLMEYTNQKNTTDKKTKPMKALNAFMAFRCKLTVFLGWNCLIN